ncbi:Uncharacterised protein [Legionella wadsworthii]|uniref:Uncharacterized protein n=2 Tax=Legionella wadsworthii TaxID=28088 RepID=A0A378LLX9_9GAMM|nr:Uncharacterised protein [Legionella wadsworthii]
MSQSMCHKIKLFLALFLSFTLNGLYSVTHAANKMLLPPWYLLNHQLVAALDADPCVKVGDLTGEGMDMEIKIKVCKEDKARALAYFINRQHDFGNMVVTVKVYTEEYNPVEAIAPTTIKETVDLLNQALKGNKYFIKAGIGIRHQMETAYALFRPMIIQYYSDDISDWFLNTNEVAAKIFGAVLRLDPYSEDAIKIYPSTEMIEEAKFHQQ